MEPVLQVCEPNCFRLREVLIINAIGFIPAVLLGTMGVLSIFFLIFAFPFHQYLFLLFAVIALAISSSMLFFFPIALGNPYVRSIAKKIKNDGLVGVSTVCQVRFSPRVHSGFRGFMEDADDVGRLYVMNESLSFVGDHIRFVLPFDSIKEVYFNNVGWRGLWLYDKRVRILTDAFDHYESLELCERCSNTLASSQRITREVTGKIPRNHMQT